MSTLPLATVRNNLSAVVDQVEGTHERVVITRNGVPAAVLISPADLAALEETLDVLSDAESMDRLRRSRADVERGDVLDGEQLRRPGSPALGGARRPAPLSAPRRRAVGTGAVPSARTD